MKILLVCSGGMSTTIVVKSLMKEAQKEGLDLHVEAVGTQAFQDEVKKDYDAAMVAPQIRHRYDTLKKLADEAGVPCGLIEPRAYSPMGGDRLLKQIKSLTSE
ncbi:MAG: PTS sugar transporter subunit IIB [Bacillota bacterium]